MDEPGALGPVKNVSLFYSGPASSTNGDTLYHGVASVSNTTPIKITTVGKLHLSDGDTVRIDQVEGDTAANGTFKIRNVTRNTFELFDAAMGKTPRLRRRPDEGFLPGEGGRTGRHLPRDASLGKRRGSEQKGREAVSSLATGPAEA